MDPDRDLLARRPQPRGFACHTAADPGRVWAALTSPDQISVYLYGLAAHSTWEPDAPIEVEHDGRAQLTGRVLCARPHERLSYLLQAGVDDPPVYLTWLIRPKANGCTIGLEIDEVEAADSPEVAEDTWLPVLAALQQLLFTS